MSFIFLRFPILFSISFEFFFFFLVKIVFSSVWMRSRTPHRQTQTLFGCVFFSLYFPFILFTTRNWKIVRFQITLPWFVLCVSGFVVHFSRRLYSPLPCSALLGVFLPLCVSLRFFSSIFLFCVSVRRTKEITLFIYFFSFFLLLFLIFILFGCSALNFWSVLSTPTNRENSQYSVDSTRRTDTYDMCTNACVYTHTLYTVHTVQRDK